MMNLLMKQNRKVQSKNKELMNVDLKDGVKVAELDEALVELQRIKQAYESIWNTHLNLCEQAGQELQEIAKLKAKIERLSSDIKEAR